MDRLRCRVLGLLFSSMLVLGLVPATVVGQTGLATLTGIVSDTSGGAVPGVTVSATHQETNVVYTGVTNSAGNYVITALPIGTYVASVELAGFKGVRAKLSLSAGQNAGLNFKLETIWNNRLAIVMSGSSRRKYPTR